MRTYFSAAVLIAAIGLTGQAWAADAQVRHVFHGVTLIDPIAETVRQDSYIAVEEDRIVEIGRGMPASGPDRRLHDFSGAYAMPGLIDTHAHVTLGPVRLVAGDGSPKMVADYRPDIVAHNARHLLSFGVTTIRNPGGDMAANRAYSEAIAAGTLDGPEALHAAEVIGRAPFPFEGLLIRPSPDLSVTEIVRRQVAEGADAIKLYTGLSAQDLREGVAAAHANGLGAIAHLRDVSWTSAAEMGIDSLVHMMPISPDLLPQSRREAYRANRRPGSFEFFEWYEAADFDAEPIRRMIATLARNEVFVEATLVAFEPAFWGDDPALLNRDRRHAHPDMVANWHEVLRFDQGWQAADHRRAQTVWPKALELTRRLHEGGVPMTIGTDLANPFVAPGIAMAREMALHRRAGISRWAVLRMATSEGARLLGIEGRTGRLAPGYEADILFTAANPLEAFFNLTKVKSVMSDGELYDPSRLRRGGQGDRG